MRTHITACSQTSSPFFSPGLPNPAHQTTLTDSLESLARRPSTQTQASSSPRDLSTACPPMAQTKLPTIPTSLSSTCWTQSMSLPKVFPETLQSDLSRQQQTQSEHQDLSDEYSSFQENNESEPESTENKAKGDGRRFREFVPDTEKDETYWEKRRKNNEAARRSREKRRMNDIILAGRINVLEDDNSRLRLELLALRKRFNLHDGQSNEATEILPNNSTSPPMIFDNSHFDNKLGQIFNPGRYSGPFKSSCSPLSYSGPPPLLPTTDPLSLGMAVINQDVPYFIHDAASSYSNALAPLITNGYHPQYFGSNMFRQYPLQADYAKNISKTGFWRSGDTKLREKPRHLSSSADSFPLAACPSAPFPRNLIDRGGAGSLPPFYYPFSFSGSERAPSLFKHVSGNYLTPFGSSKSGNNDSSSRLIGNTNDSPSRQPGNNDGTSRQLGTNDSTSRQLGSNDSNFQLTPTTCYPADDKSNEPLQLTVPRGNLSATTSTAITTATSIAVNNANHQNKPLTQNSISNEHNHIHNGSRSIPLETSPPENTGEQHESNSTSSGVSTSVSGSHNTSPFDLHRSPCLYPASQCLQPLIFSNTRSSHPFNNTVQKVTDASMPQISKMRQFAINDIPGYPHGKDMLAQNVRNSNDVKYLDPKYLERRRKNNEAARKCRENRKSFIKYRQSKSNYLENENCQLRVEVTSLQEEMKQLRDIIEKRNVEEVVETEGVKNPVSVTS